jgi:hypothetical protein
MSIPFRCDCGKQLAAKDEFAGKRLKCPACGKLLTIPRRAALTPTRPAGATHPHISLTKTQPAPRGFIRFVCSCGRKLKARLADAGLEIDCPICGQEMKIPEADGATTAPKANAMAPPTAKKPVPPPLTARSVPTRPAPETTKTKPLNLPPPAPPTNRNLMEASDPLTSHPAPAPITTRRPMTADTAAVLDDGLSQRSAPWRDDQVRARSGRPPAEPKVRSRWLAAVMVLAIIGLIGLEWYLVRQVPASHAPTSTTIPEATLIPEDAVSVVTFRVAEVANDKTRPGDGVLKVIRQILEEKDIHWPPARALERVTLVTMPPPPAPKSQAPAPPPADPKGGKGQPKGQPKGPKTPPYANTELTILRAREAFKEPPLLDALETNKPGRERIGKLAYSYNGDRAAMFPNDTTVVKGNKASVAHFVRAPKESESAQMSKALKDAGIHDLVIAVNLAATQVVPQGKQDKTKHLKNFTSALVMMDDSSDGGSNPKMLVRLIYDNSKEADLAKKELADLNQDVPAEATGVTGTHLVAELPVNEKTLQFLNEYVTFIHTDTRLKSR